MAQGYDRIRRTAPRRIRLADRMVDMQLTYRPGDTSCDGYDGPTIIGGVSVYVRVDGRMYGYGYGYVLADGSVDAPRVGDNPRELGEYGRLGAVLDGDYRDDLQALVPEHVQPWRWRGERLVSDVPPAAPVVPVDVPASDVPAA